MSFAVLPDQTDQLWVPAVATLLVAAAALMGAVAPMLGRRLTNALLTPANDNEFGAPGPRLRAV